MAAFTDLLGDQLTSATGPVDTATALADKKFVMLYFSAHWCPPCRGFTPVLAKKYSSYAASNKDVEIVFLSSDQGQSEFESYFKSMPWLALP